MTIGLQCVLNLTNVKDETEKIRSRKKVDKGDTQRNQGGILFASLDPAVLQD